MKLFLIEDNIEHFMLLRWHRIYILVLLFGEEVVCSAVVCTFIFRFSLEIWLPCFVIMFLNNIRVIDLGFHILH